MRVTGMGHNFFYEKSNFANEKFPREQMRPAVPFLTAHMCSWGPEAVSPSVDNSLETRTKDVCKLTGVMDKEIIRIITEKSSRDLFVGY